MGGAERGPARAHRPQLSLPQSLRSPNPFILAVAACAEDGGGLGLDKSVPSPLFRAGSNLITTPFTI